jgi:sialate O-acetylesterase
LNCPASPPKIRIVLSSHSKFRWLYSLFLVSLFSISAHAELKLARIFGSNMVLQQEKPIAVWGWDTPNSNVTVTLGDKSEKAAANAKGEWKVKLPALKAGTKPYTLTAVGSTTVTLDNILIGEVWLASGQSNMDWALSQTTDGPKDAAAADFPEIRFFKIDKDLSPNRKPDIATGSWRICGPKTIGGFSGVAFYFGRDLYQELKVPIGLVQSTVPGTPIEPWMSTEAIAQITEKGPVDPTKKKAWPPPTQLYNGMIQPLAPFAFRGAIWYQGEGNSSDGKKYAGKMKALIENWRKTWQDPLPFYFVQIGRREFKPEENKSPTALPEFWEAQNQAAAALPDSGVVVINDVCGTDLHPRNKKDVGNRLARLALAKNYGRTNLVYSGPVYKAAAPEGSKLRIQFDHVGGGLVSRDRAPLTGFELVDANTGGFVPATAEISGATVVVSAPDVKSPVAVRFAWGNNVESNLMNKEGLPAGSFRAGTVPARLNETP